MPRCKNKVDQNVPDGYDYRVSEMDCGDTGFHGNTLRCDDCEKEYRSAGRCEHGNNNNDYCQQCDY